MATDYFNTTDATAEELEIYEAAAGAQDKAVLELFKRLSPHRMAPSACHEMLIKNGMIDPRVPLTSIRRSITTLTNKGLLTRSKDQVPGPYRRSEYLWKLAESVRAVLVPAEEVFEQLRIIK